MKSAPATPSERVILGIDPGTNIMGYGIITAGNGPIGLQAAGVIQLNKLANHALKLRQVFERTLRLIENYHPDEVSIEAPFFGKNVQSMLKLGRAQGVAMAAALHSGIPIFEYSPKKIKLAVTGNGNASKEQVAAMLQKLIGFDRVPRYLDATDGLAAAVCHCFQSGVVTGTGVKKDWKTFISQNPDKVLRPSGR